jgi:hypothetical protein
MRQRYKGYHRVSYKGTTWIVKNRKSKAPQWVLDLAEDVVKKHTHKRIPVITWRQGHGFHSSGREFGIEKRIAITAGTDEQDQKLVVLHELAHYLCPVKAHHNMRFWRTAWMLYKEYDIPEEYAFKREQDYKKKAVTAFNEMKGGE